MKDIVKTRSYFEIAKLTKWAMHYFRNCRINEKDNRAVSRLNFAVQPICSKISKYLQIGWNCNVMDFAIPTDFDTYYICDVVELISGIELLLQSVFLFPDYKKIATIPAGSRNIEIEEISPSENTIAISDKSEKKFYLNGDQ